MSRKSKSKGTTYLILAAVVAVILIVLWRKSRFTLAKFKAQVAANAQGAQPVEFNLGTSLQAPLG